MEALRAGAAAGDDPEDGAIQKLIHRLEGLRSTLAPAKDSPATAPLVSSSEKATLPSQAPSEREQTEMVYDFLAPAQGPGELGRLGPYRVLKVLGAGGMGVVFQAEDTHLERMVALKVMLPAVASRPSARQRFLREAKAAAAIEHDHIVPIFQVGEDRGVPFLAMPLLKGEPLDGRLKRENKLPTATVLRIGREVAEGLAAAHEHGLIHRDIKPGNIWLEGGRGRVKILDFGLARAAADTAHLTQSGAIVGTPAYMAPEQTRGGTVDQRADLFSLGCVLYRLTTGGLPFKGADTMSTLMSLTLDDPTPPRELDPNIPAALSDLVMRLLAKKPEDRPQTAQAVVERIQAIEQRRDESTEVQKAMDPAHPVVRPVDRTAPASSGRFRARSSGRRWVLVAVAVALGALGVGGYLSAPTVYRIVTDQGELVIETAEPDVEVTVKQGGEVVKIVDPKTQHEIILKAGSYRVELPKGSDFILSTDHFTLQRNGQVIVKVSLNPKDAAKEPAPEEKAAKPALLYSIPFWDAQQHVSAHIYQTGISSDGRLFFGAGDAGPTGTIRVWEVATGKQVQELVPGGGAWTSFAQFVPGGNYLVASYSGENGGYSKDLFLWGIATGKVVRKFVGYTESGSQFAVSPDGKRLLSWGDDKTARLWNVDTGKELRQLEGHTDKAAGVFSPDGKQVLTFSPDKTLRLWDVESGKELQKLEGYTDACTGCFSPDGKQALSYGPDGTIRLWDLGTGKEVRRFEGLTGKVGFAGFVAGGRLVVGRSDGDLKYRVWETGGGKLVNEIDGAQYGRDGWSVTATPDGRQALVSVEADGSVRVLDLATGKETFRYDGCPKARAFSFTPDGTVAVAGSFRHGMFVFRLPPK